MNIIKRVFKLYDRMERLEKMVVRLSAELKAEKAVAKINEQALVSCEKQLGMDEAMEKADFDGAAEKCKEIIEQPEPLLEIAKTCETCRHRSDCEARGLDICADYCLWMPRVSEKAPILPSESVEDGQPNKCTRFDICINYAQQHNACYECSDFRRFIPKGRCSTCKHCGEGLMNCNVIGPCCISFDRWEKA